MANRTRPIPKSFRVSEEENSLIQKKMELANTTNFEKFARQMLMDGLVIHKDFSDIRSLIAELSRIGNNINQIAKKVNATGNFSRDDMKMINQNYDQLTKEINRALLQIIYEDRRGS